ncbi:GNAT family N-acetyltransferase [Oerskovia sp. M15]
MAGFAVYVRQPGQVVFTHTEVDDAYAGHGVGSTLARGALDHVRASGQKVVPLCPFIRAYVQLHEEYQDLVVADAGRFPCVPRADLRSLSKW